MAQSVLSGNVSEEIGKTKEPIMGANVVLVNSQNRYIKGAVTDIDGNYSIQVPANAGKLSVRVSYIGMQTQTVKYTDQTRLDFVLTDDASSTIGEVVVRGSRSDNMGVNRLGQTSSIQSLKMNEIVETTPVATIEEALQGQISGLDITIGGDPGSRNAIRIRGTSTLTGDANPLIVVDGVPYDTEISDDFNFATANDEDFGALLNIAPSNIESIDVLKDASATAIYGSKGANGVLLINTKKGAMGKTQFQFSSKLSSSFEPASIPLLNGAQYTALMQDELWNAANAKGIGSAANEMNMLFNSDEINYNPNYRYYNEYNTDTDWLGAVKRNSLATDNNFSMSGGGEKARYRFALGYYDEQGTTRGTGLARLSSQLKVTYNFSDRLRVHTDFSFTNTNKEANARDDVRYQAQKKMPNLSPYYINPLTLEPTDVYFCQESDFQGAYNTSKNAGTYNPIAMVDLGYNKTTSREEKMTITLEYDFPFHLRFTGWVSMNMKTNKNRKFLPQEATGVLWTNSNANQSTDATSDSFTLQSEGKLIYNNTFADKHSLVGTLIARMYQGKSFSSSNVTYGNASTSLSDPIVGSTVASAGSGNSESRSVATTAQLVYIFDNRYSLKGTMTYEGNSAMGSKNRFGAYPAFGASWNIDQEHWWSDSFRKFLTEAKLRVGAGWSGKAPSGAALYYGAYASQGQYVDQSAIGPIRMQLDKLKWEMTREINVGLDLRLWDKLGITFEYYDKETSDLLLGKNKVNLPSTTGYSTIAWYNSGVLTNKGFELRFDYQILKNKIWTITANANCSRNINRVKEIPATYKEENYTFGNGNYALRIVEGAPIGAFYGYKYLGVYQNTQETYARDAQGNIMTDYRGQNITMRNGTELAYPGDAKYEDINHDGVINENDIVYLGNANPKLIFGGGFQVKYRDFTLTTFFYGRLGQKVINRARMNLESMHGTENQSTAVLQRWRTEGDVTDIPRALYGMGYNYLGSDRFVEDATFVRLKNLNLTWNMPRKTLDRLHMGITKLSLGVTAYNLLTWTGYSGQDPEVGMPSATSLVQDNSTTPVSKKLTFNLGINF